MHGFVARVKFLLVCVLVCMSVLFCVCRVCVYAWCVRVRVVALCVIVPMCRHVAYSARHALCALLEKHRQTFTWRVHSTGAATTGAPVSAAHPWPWVREALRRRRRLVPRDRVRALLSPILLRCVRTPQRRRARRARTASVSTRGVVRIMLAVGRMQTYPRAASARSRNRSRSCWVHPE